MTERVALRYLQQNASELIQHVQEGERVEITRNGRLVAVLGPPDPEEQIYHDLLAAGRIDPPDTPGGVADWKPLSPRPGIQPLSDALADLREDER